MGIQFIMAVLAAITMALCSGPVNAFNSFRRTTRDNHLAGDEMEEFCQSTRNPIDLQQSLTGKLGRLMATLNDTMDATEQLLASYVTISTRFSQQQVLSSLISDLDWMQRGLTCMGRALDIHCPHLRHHHCPHHLPRLYRHNILPPNAQRLRSDLSFSLRYHDMMYLLRQLRASVSYSGDSSAGMAEGQHGDGCSRWENNSALVVSLSFVHASAAQALLEDVSLACVGYL